MSLMFSKTIHDNKGPFEFLHSAKPMRLFKAAGSWMSAELLIHQPLWQRFKGLTCRQTPLRISCQDKDSEPSDQPSVMWVSSCLAVTVPLWSHLWAFSPHGTLSSPGTKQRGTSGRGCGEKCGGGCWGSYRTSVFSLLWPTSQKMPFISKHSCWMSECAGVFPIHQHLF